MVQLFSDFTWTQANHTLEQQEILKHWTTRWTGIYANLVLFIFYQVSELSKKIGLEKRTLIKRAKYLYRFSNEKCDSNIKVLMVLLSVLFLTRACRSPSNNIFALVSHLIFHTESHRTHFYMSIKFRFADVTNSLIIVQLITFL